MQLVREAVSAERWSQARNILAVRLDNLGDVLMTTPALRAIKESDPLRRITLLASDAGAEAARNGPEIDEVIHSYREAGVRHIVALRGDPVGGLGTAYEPHPGGYRQACDLVRGIKAIGDFEVSVSAYPEKHPEAGSLDADIDAL